MSKLVKHKKIQHILFGFLFASSVYLFLEYRYEDKVLQAFIHSIHNKKGLNTNDEKEVMLAAMEKTYLQMRQKEITAMGMDLGALESFFTSPLMNFALTKDGACGGNSLVLAQILKGMGYEVRPAHMKVNGKYGGHIVLETKLYNKWVILDPLYNLCFKTPNGEIASFEEINKNWDYYKLQTPITYNQNYSYDGIRYTNWDRVPLIGQFSKSTLAFFAGEESANKFSLRKYFLNPKKVFFYLSIYLLGFSIISILNRKYIHISLPNFKRKRIAIGKMSTHP